MTKAETFAKSFLADKTPQDACLVTSHSNRFYLSGFRSSAGIVFLTKDKAYLIVDFRYYEMACNKVGKSIEVILADGRFSDYVEELIKKHKIERLWFEDCEMTVNELSIYQKRFEKIEFCYIGNALADARAVKTPEEISFISEAQKITDKAFTHILDFISKGKTESKIALELEFFMRSNNSDGVAFDTISVSGAKSSLPHGTPSDMVLTENSFITMDFGAKYNGYCADMTRTVVLGHANDEMKKVYNTVLEAQMLALDKIRAGVLGSIVDKAARDHIYSSGYEGCFGHSTGHGLGIDVHESPSFSPNYAKPIPENAVLSVEPGIYLEGRFGVRIEDIVVVKRDGYENLTCSPKELIEI